MIVRCPNRRYYEIEVFPDESRELLCSSDVNTCLRKQKQEVFLGISHFENTLFEVIEKFE